MNSIKNIITQIDQIANEDPDRIAYDYLGETATYGELKAKSDGLAVKLTQSNLQPQAPIIVYGAQTFDMIATFLGVVKSGHAYIPIDQHSPAERLTMINEIAHPTAVVAVEDLPISMGDTLVIEGAELQAAFTTAGTIATDQYVSEDENYYIIFTSGTTGQPKGVQISHNNLLSFVNWVVDDFDLPDRPVSLSQAPYSFDLSVMDLYPTLVMGGTLKVVPKAVTDDFKQLFTVLPTLNLDMWVSTPSFMDICLLQPTFDEEHLPSLKRFLFCGEELTHITAENLKKRFPSAKVFNTYGPTEATVAVTAIEIIDQVLTDNARLPIGKAKSGTKVWVADQDGNQLPAGEEGELYISGPSVSKGYLNNPTKTEAAFSSVDGTQVYRSGDLVVMNEDGMIFYRGRTDFQIKLHGYRIELEEVNHYLNNATLIQQGVAVPKYDKDQKVSQLVAYVVPATNDFDTQVKLTVAIKENLKQEMMEYMIPNRFIFVESLPQTANGKVDIKAMIAEANK